MHFLFTGSAGTPTVESHPGFPGADDDLEQTSDDPPTIVVYLIDPFSSGGTIPSIAGMLRCFAEIMPHLSDNIKNSVVLQVRKNEYDLSVEGCLSSTFSIFNNKNSFTLPNRVSTALDLGKKDPCLENP